jgi:hypothetical protein
MIKHNQELIKDMIQRTVEVHLIIIITGNILMTGRSPCRRTGQIQEIIDTNLMIEKTPVIGDILRIKIEVQEVIEKETGMEAEKVQTPQTKVEKIQLQEVKIMVKSLIV